METIILTIMCLSCFAAGFLWGRLFAWWRHRAGYIEIDATNPEKDLFTLHLQMHPVELMTKKAVIFDIETKLES